MSAAPRVLVAGIGNIFLGDDGFGCEVARQLSEQPLPDGVRVTDYGIRGMHLAYDLLEFEALVLVDTVPGRGSPGALHVLEVGPDDLAGGEIAGGGLDAHGMAPTAVLASLGMLGGSLPPTVVVGCEPGTVDDRIGLSDPVAAAVPLAVRRVQRLLDEGFPATVGDIDHDPVDRAAPAGPHPTTGSPSAAGKET